METVIFTTILFVIILAMIPVEVTQAAVTKPLSGSFPESAELGTRALICYEVNNIPTGDSRCPEEILLCHTPNNNDCGSEGSVHRYIVREVKNVTPSAPRGSWYCAIEIPRMREDDVGQYYLCKKDQATGNCNNFHVTNFGAWYVNENGVVCGITYDETLEERVDNCTSTSTSIPMTSTLTAQVPNTSPLPTPVPVVSTLSSAVPITSPVTASVSVTHPTLTQSSPTNDLSNNARLDGNLEDDKGNTQCSAPTPWTVVAVVCIVIIIALVGIILFVIRRWRRSNGTPDPESPEDCANLDQSSIEANVLETTKLTIGPDLDVNQNDEG